MKYKLIHTDTDEIHLCDKVTIDGFDYYVSDEEININDWYYLPRTNNIYQCKEDATELNLERVFGTKKVIATNNPNIDIPKVVDEVEKLAENHWIYQYIMALDEIEFDKWANQPHPEDKRQPTAVYVSHKDFWWHNHNKYTSDELIQIWKEQKPKIVYYES